MRIIVFCAFAISLVAAARGDAQQRGGNLERATRVLRSTPLVDGHNDLPWAIREHEMRPRDVEAYDLRLRTSGHTDLDRLRRNAAAFIGIGLRGLGRRLDVVERGRALRLA